MLLENICRIKSHDISITILNSDNDREFVNNKFEALCIENDIIHLRALLHTVKKISLIIESRVLPPPINIINKNLTQDILMKSATKTNHCNIHQIQTTVIEAVDTYDILTIGNNTSFIEI